MTIRLLTGDCREVLPTPFVPATVPEGPRRWAHALKAREEGGERLTPVQRSAWREALAVVGAVSVDEVQP